jgi:multicomponent Na+:H+ antiporter subunit D
MLLAMGITAALCILIGCFYAPLYDLLPFAKGADQTVVQLPMGSAAAPQTPYTGAHSPYTVDHVIPQFQLLMFSALAFTLLVRNGIYPPELASVNLDTDWAYRRAFPAAIARGRQTVGRLQQAGLLVFQALARQLLGAIRQLHGPTGALARTWSIEAMLTWSAVLLAAYLLLYYLS